MRAVIQRVDKASVSVNGTVTGEVGNGLMVLLGVMEGDTKNEAELLAGKVARLRIFEDSEQKMNLSVNDVGGNVLCVSQFTLCADVKKGNRPSFTPSASPTEAKALYEYFMQCLLGEGVKSVECGVFGADMKVSLINNGPVTIVLDTDIWRKQQNA